MGEHTKEDILSLAVSHLKEAKALHDNLESVYISHMDFSALTEFTEYEKRKLFR